jgi:hypothetical protein
MDYLRAIQVPFRPTSLIMIGVFSLIMTALLTAAAALGVVGLWAVIAVALMNMWVLKYCYVLLEHIADGANEPPVMEADMLSPFESRPLLQAALLVAGGMLCFKLGGAAGVTLAAVFLLVFPATVALLGMGENVFQAMNPIAWFRVIRGLGPLYPALLALLALIAGIGWLLLRWQPPLFFIIAIFLTCEVAFFGLIGSAIWLRRRALGYEPSRSPERTEAREERARVKLRTGMLDEVFQNARIGKHVDATAPLAKWLRDADSEYAVRDSLHVAEQALKWQLLPALNPIGSTLIRHLLRFGRPDAALAIFEMFRNRSPQFTMDSAPDLRILADHAESVGKEDLARSMRLETPVAHPPARAR